VTVSVTASLATAPAARAATAAAKEKRILTGMWDFEECSLEKKSETTGMIDLTRGRKECGILKRMYSVVKTEPGCGKRACGWEGKGGQEAGESVFIGGECRGRLRYPCDLK
jgi:hypothetical protein